MVLFRISPESTHNIGIDCPQHRSSRPTASNEAREGDPIGRIDVHAGSCLVVAYVSLTRYHYGIRRTKPPCLSIDLHPVVRELLWLSLEHVGNGAKCNTRGHLARAWSELTAFVVGLRVPGDCVLAFGP